MVIVVYLGFCNLWGKMQFQSGPLSVIRSNSALNMTHDGKRCFISWSLQTSRTLYSSYCNLYWIIFWRKFELFGTILCCATVFYICKFALDCILITSIRMPVYTKTCYTPLLVFKCITSVQSIQPGNQCFEEFDNNILLENTSSALTANIM